MNDIARELEEAKKLLAESTDPAIKAMAQEEIDRLAAELGPMAPENQRNAILEIRAGTGGDEAELFAGELFRLYQRFAEREGWKVEPLEVNRSDLGGVKTLTALIKGLGAFGKLRFEGGVHRVQRVPQTERSGRVHTSAATVAVLPEAKELDIQIKPETLRIDVYRSGGHGGQSVNTTDSAVRITHLPTGIVAACQDERSQLKNKEKALAILRSKLWEAERQEQTQATGSLRRAMIKSGDRADKIRTYNFPQNRVTDHRIGRSWQNLEAILDGNLEPLIQALSKADFGNDA